MISGRYLTPLVLMIDLFHLHSNTIVLAKIPKGLINTSKHKIHKINNLSTNHLKKSMMKCPLRIWSEILPLSFLNGVGVAVASIKFYLKSLLKIKKSRWFLMESKRTRLVVIVRNLNALNSTVNVFKENCFVINFVNAMIVEITKAIRKIIRKP